MSNDPNAYQLDPSSISRLLRLCDQPDEAEPVPQLQEEKRRLLRDLLADVPSLSRQALAGIPEILKRLHRSVPRLHGRAVGQILQDPATPLAELRSVKDYAKSAVAKARTESEHEAAGVIYYAAIAHALIRHDLRITDHSHQQLLDSFTSLLTREWLPGDFQSLFAEARGVCTWHCSSDQSRPGQ